MKVEILKTFKGTDGNLEYWLITEPTVEHKIRQRVLAAGLEKDVRPNNDRPTMVPTVDQIKWNDGLGDQLRLREANWNFGDLMPKPDSGFGYSSQFLAVWRTARNFPEGEVEVYPADVVSEFRIGDNWKWECVSSLSSKKVKNIYAGILRMPK